MDGDFAVYAENLEAAELFEHATTQWVIVSGMGGAKYQGLDYSKVESLMNMLGIVDRKVVLQQLRLMEAVALKELNREK